MKEKDKAIVKKIIYLILSIVIILSAILIYQIYSVKRYSREVTYDITKQSTTKSVQVPVLMYHSIKANNKGNPLILEKDKFEKEMKYLKENKYNTITLEQLYNYYVYKTKLPSKPIVITFDDGYMDNYKNAYPVLKKYNFKATIFVVTGYMDKGSTFLNIDQLREMYKHGIDIQSHTENHNRLDRMSYNEQLKELKNSKKFLEQKLNKKVEYIAYPFGQCNKNTIKAANTLGYKMGFCAFNGGKWAECNDGIYTLDRVYISSNHTIETFKQRVSSPNYSYIYLRDVSTKIKIRLTIGVILIIILMIKVISKHFQSANKKLVEIMKRR